MRASAFIFLALSLGCGSPQSRETRPAPGEEPIETASLPDEEIVPLEPEAGTPQFPATSDSPCSWAKAWSDPSIPDPLFEGLGGTPRLERIAGDPVRIPMREPPPEGDIVIEIVVLPDGSVPEAQVVATTYPPWPEAAQSVIDAVKTWRYEPPTLGGTPISVCKTIVVRP